MSTLKRWNRHHHGSVLPQLSSIHNTFRKRNCDFGSSHPGKITIRKGINTAYVRKFENKSGWRVQFWRDNFKDIPEKFFATQSDVEKYLKSKGL